MAAVLAAAVGIAAAVQVASPRSPERGFDLSVPTTVAYAEAAVTSAEPPPAAHAREATATATVESHVVVEAPVPPSSGRVVVTNNGTATANTGGNTGQNVVTGPATAVATDSVVVIK